MIIDHLQRIHLGHLSSVPREEITHGPRMATKVITNWEESHNSRDQWERDESTIVEEEHPMEVADIKDIPAQPRHLNNLIG